MERTSSPASQVDPRIEPFLFIRHLGKYGVSHTVNIFDGNADEASL